MKLNIMTNYTFRKEFKCDYYVTIGKWNKLNGSKLKKSEIISYLEGFFGKIGEEPKICNKKIANKVLVITRKGKISQFRILNIALLNINSAKCPIINKDIGDIDNQKVEKVSVLSKLDLSEDVLRNESFRMFPNRNVQITDSEETKKEGIFKVCYQTNPNKVVTKHSFDKNKLIKAKELIKELLKLNPNKYSKYDYTKSDESSFDKICRKFADYKDEIAFLMYQKYGEKYIKVNEFFQKIDEFDCTVKRVKNTKQKGIFDVTMEVSYEN